MISPELEYFYSNDDFSRKSLRRSTSTFTLAELGLDLFLVAMYTCKNIPTAFAMVNRDSFTKNIGDKAGNYIQDKVVVVSSSRLNHGSHFKGLI